MLLLLALAAAAVHPPHPPRAHAYRALGTEPFWSLTVEDARMRLERPGADPVAVATPRARATTDGRRYVTRSMRVDIARQRCSDGMSDNVYADTVSVTLGREVLHGCGGLIRARPLRDLRTIRPSR